MTEQTASSKVLRNLVRLPPGLSRCISTVRCRESGDPARHYDESLQAALGPRFRGDERNGCLAPRSHIKAFLSRIVGATSLAALAAGCSSIERLKTVGEQPALSQINNPTTKTGYKPVQMPMPAPQPASYNPNSLWRNGSRAFFKDQRAHQVGDILTVKVKITDKATLENDTTRSRKNSEDSGVTDFLGSKLIKTPASSILPGKILTADSTASSEGKGSIDRKEELLTNVAGVVTQVLPNGNLVIEGKQEVRVNYEVRELIVAGVVRPEDIESDNTIDSTKIAEARIAYGGRGQLMDVQQPRYGQQVLDVLLPF
jgi:flagellar L-ring protein precursor FlgH